MADNATTVDDTATAYVVYVPPSTSDTTIQSCLRLGVGPTTSNSDEETTYAAVVNAAGSLSGLSASTYDTSSGVAILTPGAINMLAAGGVNTTCGSSTHSTVGSSYTITQDPNNNMVISAAYTNNNLGPWTTSTFNQASTVQVNALPMAAQLTLGSSYQLTGPLSFINNYGFMFTSNVGLGVTTNLAHSVTIGRRTVVTYATDGSINQYYTKNQASNTGAGFSWTVPVALNFKPFDEAQETYCRLVNAAAIVTDLIGIAYAAAGLGIARHQSPQNVQTWLGAAAPVAVTCMGLNGILTVLGLVLGHWMDTQTASTAANAGATSLELGEGTAVLKTKAVMAPATKTAAPMLSLDATAKQIVLETDEAGGKPRLRLDGNAGEAKLGTKDQVEITLSDASIILKFKDKGTITMSSTGIIMQAGTGGTLHSITVKDGAIDIAGTTINIDGTTTNISTLEAKVTAAEKGLVTANKAVADAAKLAADAVTAAANAAQEATQAKAAADAVAKQLKALEPEEPGPIDPAVAASLYS